MNIGAILAIYFVAWWICLFAVLPFGVRNHVEAGSALKPGTDPGAPVRPLLLPKMAATSVIALIVTAGIVYLATSGVIRLEDLPMPFDNKGY